MRKTLFLFVFFIQMIAHAQHIADAPRTRILFDNYRVHDVTTPDGIVLKVVELLDKNGQPFEGAEPELFVHGYSQNINTWSEVAEQRRKEGKRVFIANWRGHGQGATRSIGADGQDPDRDKRMTFDNLPTQDVPTLVDFVYEKSGRRKLKWIGHSMGGMMMHLALAGVSRSADGSMALNKKRAKFLESRLSSFTAVGSPVSFSDAGAIEHMVHLFSSHVGIRQDQSRKLNDPFSSFMRGWARDHSYFAGRMLPIKKGLMDMNNLSRREYEIVREYSGSDVPKIFSRSIDFNTRSTKYSSADGKLDYRALSMNKESKAKIPVLIISADNDELAPLKDQIEMSKNRGYKQVIVKNAGHIDLTFGRSANIVVTQISYLKTKIFSCRDLFGH